MSSGRPRCFSKIGEVRATALESTVGIAPQRSESVPSETAPSLLPKLVRPSPHSLGPSNRRCLGLAARGTPG